MKSILNLDDEIRDDAAVANVHARPECVEDARNPDLNFVLPSLRHTRGKGWNT